MSFPISNSRIAELLGCPPQNVTANWPLVMAALERREIWDNLVGVAALATIPIECPPIRPVKEYGGDGYHNRMYDTRTDLGNTPERDGDGALYAGRGFIQITGRANYERYGKLLGVNLVKHPDRALEPGIAAEIFAAYFQTRKVHWAAYKRDWLRVRKLVNGGYRALPEFLDLVDKLEAVLARA
ncbi:MAG: hypothetical protein L0387_11085 [Acidobacteria bacterium]|nr:hypothetical protein [Acidobacteriota bacterium]